MNTSSAYTGLAVQGPTALSFPSDEGSPLTQGIERYWGLLASLTVHLCLLIALCIVGYGMEPRAIVYEVALVGLPHALSMQAGTGVDGAAVVPLTSTSAPLVTVSAELPATPPLPLNVTAAAPQPSQTSATPPKVRKASPAQAERAVRAVRAEAPQRTSPPPASAPSAPSPSLSAAPQGTGQHAAVETGNGAQAGPVAERADRGIQGGIQESTQGGIQESTQGGGQGGMGEVFTMHQVDTMPAVLHRVTPVYPSEAKKQRVEGRVVVRLVVDATGKAIQYSVHGAEPSGYFEASALEAVGKMRFAPGKKAGQAVNTLVLLPFDFRLR